MQLRHRSFQPGRAVAAAFSESTEGIDFHDFRMNIFWPSDDENRIFNLTHPTLGGYLYICIDK
jgi:hypothetical protein